MSLKKLFILVDKVRARWWKGVPKEKEVTRRTDGNEGVVSGRDECMRVKLYLGVSSMLRLMLRGCDLGETVLCCACSTPEVAKKGSR